MPADGADRPRRRRLVLDGRAASYLEAGAIDAIPALLLHGFAGDNLTWQYNVTALAKSQRVIAPDLPGHGLTDAHVGSGDYASLLAWLEALIAGLGLRRFHLVGHSMGGSLALGLALADPSRVLSLGLIGPAGISPDFDIDFLEALLEVDDMPQTEAMIARMCPTEGCNLPLIARAHLNKLADPCYRRALSQIAAATLRPAHGDPESVVRGWENLEMPLKMIWGAVDSIVPLPAPRWRKSCAPVVLPGVGHLPHLEAPGQVNRELLSLMAETS